MPMYYFRIRSDQCPTGADYGSDLPSRDEAWRELTRVCGDLTRDACHALKPNSAWRLEMLDEEKKPIYRVSVFGEAVEDKVAAEPVEQTQRRPSGTYSLGGVGHVLGR